ncbi:MAG: SCO family protein, partial [Pseudomonadota bacterium]
MTTPKFPVTLIIAACLLAACGNSAEDKPAAGEIRLNAAFDADFALIDHHENAVTDEDFEGKPMFIYFGFTACPDVCPAALGKMTAALDHLGRRSDDVQPLFIT